MSLETIEAIFQQAQETPMQAEEVAKARAWAASCKDLDKLRDGFERIAGELARRITKEGLVLKYFAEAEDEVRRLKTLVNRFAERS